MLVSASFLLCFCPGTIEVLGGTSAFPSSPAKGVGNVRVGLGNELWRGGQPCTHHLVFGGFDHTCLTSLLG